MERMVMRYSIANIWRFKKRPMPPGTYEARIVDVKVNERGNLETTLDVDVEPEQKMYVPVGCWTVVAVWIVFFLLIVQFYDIPTAPCSEFPYSLCHLNKE
jgi:hypothetical protein